jgi:hypothetical protein
MKALLVIALVAAAGCGSQIGDACIVNSDCDPAGTRTCIDTNEKGGYCTIQGCDYNTCPSEATCVRFFTGSFENEPCMDQTQCTLDELCTLPGFCAPRSAEVRYCMRKCESDGDCRDGYECRDYNEMVDNGGEPVLPPGQTVTPKNVVKFCAIKP